MTGDSSTPGYLIPGPVPAPVSDDPLEDALQAWIVGITGLPPDLVRPRWQPKPPNMPPASTTWAAFGITSTRTDPNSSIVHTPGVPAGPNSSAIPGYDTQYRQEDLNVMVTFYGPLSSGMADELRDGAQIGQNREALAPVLMAFIESGDKRAVAEEINQQWVRRFDLEMAFRRQVQRVYAVLDLESATVALTPADGRTIVIQTPPIPSGA